MRQQALLAMSGSASRLTLFSSTTLTESSGAMRKYIRNASAVPANVCAHLRTFASSLYCRTRDPPRCSHFLCCSYGVNLKMLSMA